MLNNKFRKIFHRITAILIAIAAVGAYKNASNSEYASIVNAINNYSPKNKCNINLDVEREWPFSWTPVSMKLKVEKEGTEISTETSKWFPADRIYKQGLFKYHFDWAEESNGKMIPTYLDVAVTDTNEVKWLNIGACQSVNKKEYFSERYESCKTGISHIECK